MAHGGAKFPVLETLPVVAGSVQDAHDGVVGIQQLLAEERQ
jgi:hypothetical protein